MTSPVVDDGVYDEDYLEDPVDDDESAEDSEVQVRYQISSYGIDFDVAGLVKRLNEEKVVIPEFQRSFVWRQPDASRFIESLLLGLPVPGVFLAKEPDSNRLIVIDGQQRLKSLQFFCNGFFNPKPSKATQRTFKLIGVQPQFKDKTYQTLEAPDRQTLDDSVIHATIVKQESPTDDDTSIHHVFGRLNSGGRKLHPQEIRVAISHGRLMEAIKDMNKSTSWRQLFGRESPRLKDQELILRFVAFLVDPTPYRRPMGEFLNKFASKHRNMAQPALVGLASTFEATMATLVASVGVNAFRPERNFNAAVFDSMSVGLARRLHGRTAPDSALVKAAYERLMANTAFREAISRSTADKPFVDTRFSFAAAEFGAIP